MTKVQILVEISYILGVVNEEFTDKLDRLGFENLNEDYSLFVEKLCDLFNESKKDKEESELQLLHDFMRNAIENIEEYIEKYW